MDRNTEIGGKVNYKEGIMSLRPAFELGLWNAWIIMVLNILSGWVPHLIDREASARGMANWKDLTRTQKLVALITHGLIGTGLVVYSIFLPLQLGTVWLYVGLPICFLAMVMDLMAGFSFVATPLDEPVAKWAYRISRHPAYFSGFLMYVGIGIACASWVFLLGAVVWIVSLQIGVVDEERFLLEKYGDSYREYMNITPRWIGIPKSGEQ